MALRWLIVESPDGDFVPLSGCFYWTEFCLIVGPSGDTLYVHHKGQVRRKWLSD